MTSSWLDDLRGLVGPEGVIAKGGMTAWESDGLTLERGEGQVVVLPRSTAEVAEVMRILARETIPVVPRGAGTGLSGGATPVPGGAVVGLSRMRRILGIDPLERTAHVEAGVVNADLSRETARVGLFYAPDPSSQAACTLGGNVANNSGGPHCLLHGNTSRHVRGLVLVRQDGEVVRLMNESPAPTGLDLVGATVGHEGMFGVVTEVLLNLQPLPERVETVLAVFDSLDAACDTVTDAIAAKLEPSAIEILDRLTIEAVEASVFAAGYPRDAEAVVLFEAEGGAAEVEATVTDLVGLAEARGCVQVQRARDAGERARLWAGRKGAFGAMGRVAPDLYVADVVAPRTRLREIVRLSADICEELDLRLANVFHAGDGNLHPNISYDRRDADEVARVLEAGRRIMAACVERGGSLTGEHGVGLEKQAHMCDVFDDADLDVMQRVRTAADPARLMNPGKTLPVRACREARGTGLPADPRLANSVEPGGKA